MATIGKPINSMVIVSNTNYGIIRINLAMGLQSARGQARKGNGCQDENSYDLWLRTSVTPVWGGRLGYQKFGGNIFLN